MILEHKVNILEVKSLSENGALLGDRQGKEVFLPKQYITKELKRGDEVEVFVFVDAKEEVIATMTLPNVEVDQFAVLTIRDMEEFGLFLESGFPKDVFLPAKLRISKNLKEGQRVLVYLFSDPVTGKLTASEFVDDYVHEKVDFELNEKVDAIVWLETPLGFKVLIAGCALGMLYRNELHQMIRPGDQLEAYVKQVRPDGKIDLSIEPQGYKNTIDIHEEKVIQAIQKAGGFLDLTDKSEASLISKRMQMSKKSFKRAVGALYKKRWIKIEEKGIRWVKEEK